MRAKATIDANLMQDYLERRLSPEAERRLEEAIIDDPDLAEQVRLEMALRDGMREMRRAELSQPLPAAANEPNPRVAAHATRAAGARDRAPTRDTPRRRALRWATAAALGLFVLPGAWIMATLPQSNEGTALEMRTQSATRDSYLLPTSFDDQARDAIAVSVPQPSRDIVLELGRAQRAAPHRLMLRSARSPDISIVLTPRALPDDGQGFVLTAEQMRAGPFAAELERQDNGAWVSAGAFVLRADGAL